MLRRDKELEVANHRLIIEKDAYQASIGSYVITDKETGVQYLYLWGGTSGSVFPLLDADGKPRIVDVEEVIKRNDVEETRY